MVGRSRLPRQEKIVRVKGWYRDPISGEVFYHDFEASPEEAKRFEKYRARKPLVKKLFGGK